MTERDRPVTAALRTALGAIANAEAVPLDQDPLGGRAVSAHVAGAVAGVGTAEVPRREMPEAEARAIVERQRAELRDHAGRLAQLCRFEQADAARRAVRALDELLGIEDPTDPASDDVPPPGLGSGL